MLASDLERIDMAATNLTVKMRVTGTSLAVQSLRLRTSNTHFQWVLVPFLVRELRTHMQEGMVQKINK